jgi:hypothetical protein
VACLLIDLILHICNQHKQHPTSCLATILCRWRIDKFHQESI